ncbi:MAG: hypothetical protein OHK0046_06640 [Anaerolineae bacterium]
MSEVDTQQAHTAILREVIHTIAVTPEPRDCIQPVLEAARRITKAQGAALLIFDDPRLLVLSEIDGERLPDDKVLSGLAMTLAETVVMDAPLPEGTVLGGQHWLLGRIRGQKKIVALFWLVFDVMPAMAEDDHNALLTIVDSLSILTHDIMAAARQEKLGRNQSEFMRIVSHDLRSPLTSMQGFASMLESGMVGELSEKQEHFVQKILAGIAQMASLVDNIQDAGRYDPETGFYEMERTQCDPGELVELIVRSHLLPAEKQELTLMTDIAEDIPIIRADVNMIERAISNLVDNAIKYTPNGGKIIVGVARQGEYLLIKVKDNGLGISKENQKLLFERHVRIPRQEHKKVKGSGLGLFIVRSVARRHGGDAWVESEEGAGATFFISIPLNEENSLLSF